MPTWSLLRAPSQTDGTLDISPVRSCLYWHEPSDSPFVLAGSSGLAAVAKTAKVANRSELFPQCAASPKRKTSYIAACNKEHVELGKACREIAQLLRTTSTPAISWRGPDRRRARRTPTLSFRFTVLGVPIVTEKNRANMADQWLCWLVAESVRACLTAWATRKRPVTPERSAGGALGRRRCTGPVPWDRRDSGACVSSDPRSARL